VNFFLRHRLQTGSVAHQPPIQWVPGALTPGVKLMELEADHSPHLMPRLRMSGAIPSLPNVFLAWCLVQHKNFTFTFRVSMGTTVLSVKAWTTMFHVTHRAFTFLRSMFSVFFAVYFHILLRAATCKTALNSLCL
jgi:hypothetical protein